MIARWQLVALLVLAVIAVAIGIYGAPNSYAYLTLTGRCSHKPMPIACHPLSRRGG